MMMTACTLTSNTHRWEEKAKHTVERRTWIHTCACNPTWNVLSSENKHVFTLAREETQSKRNADPRVNPLSFSFNCLFSLPPLPSPKNKNNYPNKNVHKAEPDPLCGERHRRSLSVSQNHGWGQRKTKRLGDEGARLPRRLCARV